jgi:nitrogen fixation/metabolism regulation signal transduction histidine kinase
MNIKNFRINIIFRILVLSCTVVLLFYFILNTSKIATIIVISLLVIYEIYALISYTEKTNNELSRFLNAIEYSDFSQTFSKSFLGSSFRELDAAFNKVIEKFKKSRSETEEHVRYLETVVQHVGVGLIAYDQNGNIQFINNAAKRLLNVPNVRNIAAFKKVGKNFIDALFNIKAGDKIALKLTDEDDIIQLVMYATEFKLRDKRYTLVSLQNIQSELEEKETEAWQQLIRVLTHEIMNSITPISSLASTVNQMLAVNREQERILNEETMDDVNTAMSTIQRRSEGLIHFVDTYRNLTKIPEPNFEIFQVVQLFRRVKKLMETELKEGNVEFNMSVKPESLELTADPELIEQVIINLIINARQALEGNTYGKITINSYLDERGKVVIRVSDNGPGIPEETLEKIFIPFFTTKKNGSGIGLSLAKQIMRLHRGAIRVSSKPHEETSFTLRF